VNGLVQTGGLKKNDETNDGNRKKVKRTPAPHGNKISDNRRKRNDPEK